MKTASRAWRRVPSVAKAAGALGAAWSVGLTVPALYHRLAVFIASSNGWMDGPVSSVTRDIVNQSAGTLQGSLFALLATTSLAVPVALLVRMVARARVRAGLPDPLDPARRWAAEHPFLVRALRALPALVWLVSVPELVWWMLHWGGYFQYGHLTGTDAVLHLRSIYLAWMGGFLGAMTGAAVGVYAATRPAVRAFLSPTVDIRDAADADAPTSERRMGFDAVAVTAETRAAVALMAALPVAAFFAIQAAHLGETGTEVALAAYVSVAIGGALAFRRASRIAIGVDGVFVTGSSRSRFFAYKDVDDVRAGGSEIELLRKGRSVLRLQLHGRDATERDAITLRLREAIEAAKARKTGAVGEIVRAATDETLARLADGAEGYRSASVTREQLWSVVGAPEHDAEVRTAAARALVEGGGEGERARLRVAARECAQPGVRGALLDLAGDDIDEDADDGSSAPARRARSRY